MMKPALTTTMTIFVCVLAAGLVSAQSPSIIQNTRATMNGVSNNTTAASNEALGIRQSAPAVASGKPAAAKSSGAAVVTPVKSSVKASSTSSKSKTAASSAVSKTSAVAKTPVVAKTPAVAKSTSGAKRIPVVVAGTKAQVKPVPTVPKSKPPAGASTARGSASGSGTGSGEGAPGEQPVVPDSKYAANGRRDPFISPVVSHAGGSGCSTGKKCLEIGAINLRGVVRAESGFIAVVSNDINKAYFLRENDPVFNGYVMKITGDSIVFQETLQDRLGKTFTREVVKKITTPAV
jgi:hypothetical protein